MRMKIDNLDLEIIKHLQQDARLSFRKLGRKLGVPHTTVFTRAERLLDRGVIKNFSAILHPHDLGLQIGFIFVDAPPSQSKEIAAKLSSFDEVRKVFRTFDGKIIAKVVVPRGHHGFEEFLTKLDSFPINAYPVHEVVKFDHSIPESGLKSLHFYKEG
ncbi:MAG TPA: AsnC family transcriptional regulator [Candidatus Altiarchaeales archaeon]|nr:AsnC family transcriptional regulator [Candidatus Altiarchaeales archaeon]